MVARVPSWLRSANEDGRYLLTTLMLRMFGLEESDVINVVNKFYNSWFPFNPTPLSRL